MAGDAMSGSNIRLSKDLPADMRGEASLAFYGSIYEALIAGLRAYASQIEFNTDSASETGALFAAWRQAGIT